MPGRLVAKAKVAGSNLVFLPISTPRLFDAAGAVVFLLLAVPVHGLHMRSAARL